MSGFSYTLKDIAKMIGPEAKLLGAENSDVLSFVEFDTRQLHDGFATLFVAIKGPFRDGHQFLNEAKQLGVQHYLVSDAAALPEGASGILVPDTIVGLQAFAKSHREKFDYPVVAITGSNGKTTVKEWLVTMVGESLRVVKSPQSYNSQIGVALSLLGMGAQHALAVIEVGISKKGEMARLANMVKPDIGILSHFGDAHAEGFESPEEKLSEKMRLFEGVSDLFVDASTPWVAEVVREFTSKRKQHCILVGTDDAFDVSLSNLRTEGTTISADLSYANEVNRIAIPVPGEAALFNAALGVAVCLKLGLPFESIPKRLHTLRPVTMRMEMITDNPEITIINDAYNADLASFKNALSLLATERFHASSILIITDIDHQGKAQVAVQREMLELATETLGAENLILIGPVFDKIVEAAPWVTSFVSTEAFLEQFFYERFRNRTVLLKGARRFGLDRLIPYLSRRATATWFKINMNAVSHNLRQFRRRIPKGTKVMAMVKAFAYGLGSWEIAQAVVREGADELAVAYTTEGIMLRTRGVRVPIMVMNADLQGLEQLYRFKLVPEVYNLEFLKAYIAAGKKLGKTRFPVHIKVDTGMSRLGFFAEDPSGVIQLLGEEKGLVIESVMSHLSSADDAKMEDFTRGQVKLFEAFFAALSASYGAEAPPKRHILNTAGILRYPEYAFEMVRLGIGIYGISPFKDAAIELEEIGSLHSVLSQVHHYEAGTPIGYGCSERTTRASLIATVPIGYADGIRRSLSNGVGRFLVRGQRVPVIGRVCMDMLMLDVTDVAGVKGGDEVVLIGAQGDDFISANEIAAWCDTIPYEILTGISQRVRRVYVRE